MTTEEFVKKSQKVHISKYDYSKSNYIDKNTKIEIICKIHGSFFQIPRNHYRGQGCYKCNHNCLDKESFSIKAKKIHGDSYDYSHVIYTKILNKVKIKCNTCNLFFTQTPDNHLRGVGCPYCNKYGILTKEIFIKKATKKYKNKFDYSLVEFVNGKTKIKIKCNKCEGVFSKTPTNHLSRGGCKTCAYNNKKLTIQDFISKANKVHNHYYGYSKSVYINNHTKLQIICPKHGLFLQTPNAHLQIKSGCPKCRNRISKMEEEFLNYIQLPNTEYSRQVYILKKKVDGYDPETNTIYEFLGDYWHGNPKIHDHTKTNEKTHENFGKLYKNTINRFNFLKYNGYKIKYIWESDWIDFTKNTDPNKFLFINEFEIDKEIQ